MTLIMKTLTSNMYTELEEKYSEIEKRIIVLYKYVIEYTCTTKLIKWYKCSVLHLYPQTIPYMFKLATEIV